MKYLNYSNFSAAYLSYLFEPGNINLLELINLTSLNEAAKLIYKRKVPRGFEKLLQQSEQKYNNEEWLKIVEYFYKIGGKIVTECSDEWPEWELLQLNNDLKENKYPLFKPYILWTKGDANLLKRLKNSISILGTRSSTHYGHQVVDEICMYLAEEKLVTISGGAVGIDARVHKSSIYSEGKTISILANGILKPYPKQNSTMFEKIIAENNLILSEYFPNTNPAKHRFLIRNRLVAALSEYLLVVEAGKRSGAANTAAWGKRLGKTIYAVPGMITSKESIGCNNLIANNEAYIANDMKQLIKQITLE